MSTIGQNLRSTVLVGNVPYDISEEQLKDIFAQIGPVVNFKLFYDKESGKPKGYAVCEYRDSEMALSAIRNLSGYEIKGKVLRVDVSTSERSREELKMLQMSSGGGTSGESSRAPEVEPEKAPEAISKAVASLPPEQMFELMKQMKMCIQNNPSEARNLLLQNPQLAYALLQAQVVMRIVDPQVAMNILNRPSPNPNASSISASNSESELVKTTAATSAATATKVSTTATSALPIPVSSSQADSLTSAVPISATSSIVATSSPSVISQSLTNTSVSEVTRSSMLPPRSSQLVDMHGPPMAPEVSRTSVTPRHHPQRGIDTFGLFGDPRTIADRDMRIPRVDLGDARLSSRVDQDMRQPPAISLGDQDMRQPMGDQDFRVMRGPQMMENRPYDPRLRSMASGDTLGRAAPVAAPYDPRGPHPFDPRTAHETRPSAPPVRLEDPRTAMRSQASSRTGPTTTSAASVLAQSLPSVGNSRPPSSVIAAANAIAPHDQEKAALIMQVLQLSDDQIAMLPPGQRQSILILKEQIARSCPP